MEQFFKLDYLDELLLFKSDDYQTIKDQVSYYLSPHRFEVEVREPLKDRKSVV